MTPASDALHRARQQQEGGTGGVGYSARAMASAQTGLETPVVRGGHGGASGAAVGAGPSAQLLVVGTALRCEDVDELLDGWLV